MEDLEKKVVLKVDTEVKSVQDLKNNISILKKELDGLEIGTEKYQDTLSELRVNQNALKDAMYATSGTMQDVVNSATGATESYNSLVHRMAALKEEFRSTTDVVRRAELGATINEVNNKLKEMDALQGNFQRNVGNYAGAIKDVLQDIPDFAQPVKKSLDTIDKSMGLLSKNPLFAILTFLVPIISKITSEVKENNTAVEAIDKAMGALKPVMDFFSGVIQTISDYLADVIGKVVAFTNGNGLFQKIINGVVGIGNAVLQFVIAPVKGVIAAVKVLQEEGIKGAKDAAKALFGEMKSGVAFKSNFQAGQEVAMALTGGVKSKKKEISDEVKSAVEDGIKLVDWEKALAEGDRKIAERKKEQLELQKELDAEVLAEMEAFNEELEGVYDEQAMAFIAEKEKEQEAERQSIERRKAIMSTIVPATSSILNSIADLYEANGENDEKAAEKAKAIRIAASTIDTISGAIGAYMQTAATIPPPLGIALGAVNAATVLAAGMANIAKMRSTNISSGSSASSNFTTSAPSMPMNLPQTRVVTNAAEEERLNQMASPQKVYILQSELEASNNASRVRVAEASF